jgi:hypothetical protein
MDRRRLNIDNNNKKTTKTKKKVEAQVAKAKEGRGIEPQFIGNQAPQRPNTIGHSGYKKKRKKGEKKRWRLLRLLARSHQ